MVNLLRRWGMLPLLCLLLSIPLPTEVRADSSPAFQETVKAEARADFERLLVLWRDQRYGDVHDLVIVTSGHSRQWFIDSLNYSARRPACCWEQLQEVTLTYQNAQWVDLRARLGLEVEGVGTRFVTKTFHLVKRDGVWKVPAWDIVNLAEPNFGRAPNRPPWQVE